MDLEQFLSPLSQLTANLDPRTAALLFLACAIGEFLLPAPYLLESVWLLVGYQFGAGALSPFGLLGFWLSAVFGRQVGSLGLFLIARLGSTPLARLYQRITRWRYWPKTNPGGNLLRRININSPFLVAYGRLIGLRIPLTVMLGLKKKFMASFGGIILSSVVWDGVYIMLGATVGRVISLKPYEMLLFSVTGLTVVYLVVFVVRRLRRKRIGNRV
jgi:membrane-associated protein